MFKKQRTAFSPEQRQAIVINRLRHEDDWAPVVTDILSGKYGPHALDSSILMWDFQAVFQEAYQQVMDIPDHRKRLTASVIKLLDSRKDWDRLTAQDFVGRFAIHELAPRLLAQLRACHLRAFQLRGPSIFNTCKVNDLTTIVRALHALELLRDIESTLRDWFELFLAVVPSAFEQWNRLGRRKQDEVYAIRELAIASLQLLADESPELAAASVRRICELGKVLHPGCCRLGDPSLGGEWGCWWMQRFLAGLVKKLGYQAANDLMVKHLEGLPPEQINMVLASLRATGTFFDKSLRKPDAS